MSKPYRPPAGMSTEDAAALENLVRRLRAIIQRHEADFEVQPTGKALVRAQMRLHASLGEASWTEARLDRHPEVTVPDDPPPEPL